MKRERERERERERWIFFSLNNGKEASGKLKQYR